MSVNRSNDVNIQFVTPNLEENSTGRTYALWLLARELGWGTRVLSTRGEAVWGPLADSPFAADCLKIADPEAAMRYLNNGWASLVVAVKPLATSFGIAAQAERAQKWPLVVDIDDPDLEYHLSGLRSLRAFARSVVHWSDVKASYHIRRQIPRFETIVSNPELGRRYGGSVIPHARPDSGSGKAHINTVPEIVFVGTNRAHKGLPLLRRAVAALPPNSVKLTITDNPPGDSMPWENWVGPTSLAAGMQLVKAGDIVVIPSAGDNVFSRGQLPAKLIDAMMAGRAIIASDLPPIRWALQGSGTLVAPDDCNELAAAIRRYRDPETRAVDGAKARAVALEKYSVTALAPVFRNAYERAIAGRPDFSGQG